MLHRRVGDQHQMVEHHPGERQRAQDQGAAGGGQYRDKGQGGDGGAIGQREDDVGGPLDIIGHPHALTGPQHQRHRQCHQQQHQRQSPARAEQGSATERAGEGHVKHVGHQQCSGEEQQQQGAPLGGIELARLCLVSAAGAIQPALQIAGAVEDGVERKGAQGEKGDQLDQRLQADGGGQAVVAPMDVSVTGAEQYREQCDQGTQQQRQQARGGVGVAMDGVPHGLHLHRQQRHDRHQAQQGDAGADPAGAKAKGEQVRQG